MTPCLKIIFLTFYAEIPVICEEVYSPNLIKYCTGDAENDQDEEQHQDLRVGQLVNC